MATDTLPDDTATEAPRGLIAEPPGAGPESPPLALPAAPSLSSFAETWAKRQQAGAGLQGALRDRDATMAPKLDAATRAVEQRTIPTPPPAPVLTPPPSRGLHDFLAPTEGESPVASITKLITGLGVLATGASGLVRGNARPALAALHGALKGWQEGDRERADRAFADWKAKTDEALQAHQLDVDGWKRIIETGDLSQAQMVTALKLHAQRAGMPVESAVYQLQDADAAVKALTDYERMTSDLAIKRQHLIDAKEKADADRQQRADAAERADQTRRDLADLSNETRVQLAELSAQNARLIANASNETRLAVAEANRAAQENARREREAFQKSMRDEARAAGRWFDRETGEEVNPTKGEIAANPNRYKQSNAQDMTRYNQIVIAQPMIKRLRTLSDKLLAKESPDNLVRAAELYAQGKMVSNPDLREFGALVEDVNAKMTSIVGPGQFRITLFNVLRGVGLTTKDTRETARRVLDQWETNIDNDMRAITGQKMREHLSGPWQGWAFSPTGERKWIRVPKGERIDPGWITLEETK